VIDSFSENSTASDSITYIDQSTSSLYVNTDNKTYLGTHNLTVIGSIIGTYTTYAQA
jgi:hypothetical protein